MEARPPPPPAGDTQPPPPPPSSSAHTAAPPPASASAGAPPPPPSASTAAPPPPSQSKTPPPPATPPPARTENDLMIERILRPYIDLNPFAILSLPSSASDEDVRKQYRLLSRQVHPDRNPDNPHAQKAFELLNKAYKTLQDPAEVAFVREVIEEATRRVDEDLKARKKEYKKRLNRKKGDPKVDYPAEIAIKDKDPVRYEGMIQYSTCKVFVELDERRKRAMEVDAAYKKRKRDEDLEKAKQMKEEAEFQKKWEEGREQRVEHWRDHQKKGTKVRKDGKKRVRTMLRPPKLKTETRN